VRLLEAAVVLVVPPAYGRGRRQEEVEVRIGGTEAVSTGEGAEVRCRDGVTGAGELGREGEEDAAGDGLQGAGKSQKRVTDLRDVSVRLPGR
jgi:hypothetical protein